MGSGSIPIRLQQPARPWSVAKLSLFRAPFGGQVERTSRRSPSRETPSRLGADINVTPMIKDILLVLLIIFMVIVPTVPDGLDAAVPQRPENPQKRQQNDRTIVVQVLPGPAGRHYKINQDDVSYQELLPRLTAIYENRAERIMFIKGDDDVKFEYIANVLRHRQGSRRGTRRPADLKFRKGNSPPDGNAGETKWVRLIPRWIAAAQCSCLITPGFSSGRPGAAFKFLCGLGLAERRFGKFSLRGNECDFLPGPSLETLTTAT